MVKSTAFGLTTMVAIAVMAVSSGAVRAQPAVWHPSYAGDQAYYGYDGEIMKVRRRRGRGRGRRGRGGYWGDAAAAGVIGGIIGGAIANSGNNYAPPPANYGNAHVNWCYSRYRSYRAYDNTFQPYYGPRRQCVSPYY